MLAREIIHCTVCGKFPGQYLPDAPFQTPSMQAYIKGDRKLTVVIWVDMRCFKSTDDLNIRAT